MLVLPGTWPRHGQLNGGLSLGGRRLCGIKTPHFQVPVRPRSLTIEPSDQSRVAISSFHQSAPALVDQLSSRHADCQTWLLWPNRAEPLRHGPDTSDIDLFCYGKGVVNVDAEVPHGTFDSPVSE